jgi:hypothetical protein
VAPLISLDHPLECDTSTGNGRGVADHRDVPRPFMYGVQRRSSEMTGADRMGRDAHRWGKLTSDGSRVWRYTAVNHSSEIGKEGTMPERAREEVSDVILQRVYGEFLEMPGMRVTLSQAQRLWGLDERTCQLLLEYLVATKFLYRSAHGNYGRSSDGSSPRPRMAKAGLDAGRVK